jgi:vancomycin resistance protein YoaR
MLQVIFGGDEIDPVVDIDETEFDAAMQRVVRQVTVAPTSSKVLFSGGRPHVRYGTVGETVDLESLQENIAESLRDDERRVRLPMRLPPAAFVAALRAVETADGLRLGIDADAAFRLGASTRSQLPGQPVNARVVLGRNGPRVVQGSAGFRVTQDAWAAGVLEAALKRSGRRTATLQVVRADPAFTANDARAMQIRNRIATATIRFPASVKRSQVARAARQLDQAVLKPGAEWSFLRRVRVAGQPAATSLVASATYNAALHAGLDVTQRSAMSSPPDYHTRGREALALRPRDDLLLRNPSPYGVLLHAEVEPTRNGAQVRVEAWSTRYWKVTVRRSDRYQLTFAPPERRSGAQCQPRRGEPGYSLDLTRVRVRGDERRVDVQTSRYAPVRGVVCGGGPGR